MNKWRLLLLSVLSLLQSASAERNIFDGRDRHLEDRLSTQQPNRIYKSPHGLGQLNIPDKLNDETRKVEWTRTHAKRHFERAELRWRSSVNNDPMLTSHRKSLEERVRAYGQRDSRDYGHRTNEDTKATRVDIISKRNDKQNEDRDYPARSKPSRRSDFTGNKVTRLYTAEVSQPSCITLNKIESNSRDRRAYNTHNEARLINRINERNHHDLGENRFVRRELLQKTGDSEFRQREVKQLDSTKSFENLNRGIRNDKFSSKTNIRNEKTQEMDPSRSKGQRQRDQSHDILQVRARTKLERNVVITNNVREKRSIDSRLASTSRLFHENDEWRQNIGTLQTESIKEKDTGINGLLMSFNRLRLTNEIRHARNARDERSVRRSSSDDKERKTNDIKCTRITHKERAINEIRHTRNAREERANEIRNTRNAREERATSSQRKNDNREKRSQISYRDERGQYRFQNTRNIQDAEILFRSREASTIRKIQPSVQKLDINKRSTPEVNALRQNSYRSLSTGRTQEREYQSLRNIENDTINIRRGSFESSERFYSNFGLHATARLSDNIENTRHEGFRRLSRGERIPSDNIREQISRSLRRTTVFHQLQPSTIQERQRRLNTRPIMPLTKDTASELNVNTRSSILHPDSIHRERSQSKSVRKTIEPQHIKAKATNLYRNTREERKVNDVEHTKNIRKESHLNDIREGGERNQIQNNGIVREQTNKNDIRQTRNIREERPTNKIRFIRNVRDEKAINEIRLSRIVREERLINEIRLTQNAPEDRAINEIRLARIARTERATNDIQHALNAYNERDSNHNRYIKSARLETPSRSAREERATNEIRLTRKTHEERFLNGNGNARDERGIHGIHGEQRALNEFQQTRMSREDRVSNEIRDTRNARKERTSYEIRHMRNARDDRINEDHRNALEDRASNAIRQVRITREERISNERSRDTRETRTTNNIRYNRNAGEIRASNEIERRQPSHQERLLNTRHTIVLARGRQLLSVIQNRNTRIVPLVREKRATEQIPAIPITNAQLENNFLAKWQCLLYLLQGIYLCSLFIKMPKEHGQLKKTRTANWFTTMDYLKID